MSGLKTINRVNLKSISSGRANYFNYSQYVEEVFDPFKQLYHYQ